MTEDRSTEKMNEEITTGIGMNRNRFRLLCDNVENCFSEIDKSMFDLLELKDKLLLQYLPGNVSLQIILVFSRFYRAYSQSQIPVYELIRLVQLYTQPFDMKCLVLKRLYDSNETKKRMLNMALQRLISMENNTKLYQEQKSVNNWEKMYICLASRRSNVRKWKFRIKTFREKAELGYEHVIEWIFTKVPSTLLESEALLKEEPINDQPEVSNPQIDQDPNYENKIGNDNESKLLSSTENQKSKETEPEPIVTKIDIEIQAQPDLNNQQTSTNDILSTKSLIMRLYRPIGIAKTKLQCIVYAQGQKYTTHMFIVNKPNVPLTASSHTTKTKKHNEVLTIADNIDTIDKQQTDEFLIPMPNVFKRRSLFQTDIDPDAINIDIFGDGKLCGSLSLSSEDLLMLDLPNLQSPTLSPFIAAEDDDISTNTQLAFDQSSAEIYQSWLSRIPHTFSIYNNQHDLIGKLPLLMFWYNKLENTHATKCTMTIPMELRVPTPIVVPSPTNEIIIPSAVETMNDEDTEPNYLDNHIEFIKATYENEIVELHENYQAEISRLTNLLNEIVSSQTIQTSELNDNTPDIIQENLANTKTQRQTNREVVMENLPSLVYGKDLPKNFLDRYKMYLQRSLLHRHQLITKVEQETALATERQMEMQHRLYKSEQNPEYDDLCLPAVFMPFRSGNVFNPRAYQFFHPIGSTAPRLTQPPSVLKLPSLPSGSVSVLNLFELSRCYNTSNEKDRSIDKSATQASN